MCIRVRRRRRCVDRGSAGLPAQRGAGCSPQRQSAQHRRHQARNVEVNWICFRCILQQSRPASGIRRTIPP